MLISRLQKLEERLRLRGVSTAIRNDTSTGMRLICLRSPTDGPCFWVHHSQRTNQWYLGTWLPCIYAIPVGTDILNVCIDCLDLCEFNLKVLPEEIVAKYYMKIVPGLPNADGKMDASNLPPDVQTANAKTEGHGIFSVFFDSEPGSAVAALEEILGCRFDSRRMGESTSYYSTHQGVHLVLTANSSKDDLECPFANFEHELDLLRTSDFAEGAPIPVENSQLPQLA